MDNEYNDKKPIPEELLDEFLAKHPQKALNAAWRGKNLKELYEAEINPEKKEQYKILMEQAEAEFLHIMDDETPRGKLS